MSADLSVQGESWSYGHGWGYIATQNLEEVEQDWVLVPALPGEELVEIRLECHRRDRGNKG